MLDDISYCIDHCPYGTDYRPDPAGGMIQVGDWDGRLEPMRLWNTRAPILSAEEMEMLEGME